jgi:hypothetical protein
MASKKKESAPKDDKKGYQPKATARHAKMVKSKQDEIDALKQQISTDKHLAKKYESNRKKEIKAMPKEDRAAAKEDLKESKQQRKEAERKDKDKLYKLTYEEKAERRGLDKDHFDDEAWIKEGRVNKKKASKETPEEPQEKDPEIQSK